MIQIRPFRVIWCFTVCTISVLQFGWAVLIPLVLIFADLPDQSPYA